MPFKSLFNSTEYIPNDFIFVAQNRNAMNKQERGKAALIYMQYE